MNQSSALKLKQLLALHSTSDMTPNMTYQFDLDNLDSESEIIECDKEEDNDVIPIDTLKKVLIQKYKCHKHQWNW